MTPEQAKFLMETYVTHLREEWEITKKVFSAAPLDQLDYRPDPRARTAQEIVWHIVSAEVWFLECFEAGEFKMEEPGCPESVTTPAAAIEWYEQKAPGLIDKLLQTPGETLAAPMSFFGAYNYPMVIYVTFLISHTVHHRGQLAAYIRPMGGKVPCIYGGSADEPFAMP